MSNLSALSAPQILPEDATEAVLVGRAFVPDHQGPSVIAVRGDDAIDVSLAFPTIRDLCESANPAAALAAATGQRIGPIDALIRNTPRRSRDTTQPWLLSPIDLQAI